jgi:hypothetical protein
MAAVRPPSFDIGWLLVLLVVLIGIHARDHGLGLVESGPRLEAHAAACVVWRKHSHLDELRVGAAGRAEVADGDRGEVRVQHLAGRKQLSRELPVNAGHERCKAVRDVRLRRLGLAAPFALVQQLRRHAEGTRHVLNPVPLGVEQPACRVGGQLRSLHAFAEERGRRDLLAAVVLLEPLLPHLIAGVGGQRAGVLDAELPHEPRLRQLLSDLVDDGLRGEHAAALGDRRDAEPGRRGVREGPHVHQVAVVDDLVVDDVDGLAGLKSNAHYGGVHRVERDRLA